MTGPMNPRLTDERLDRLVAHVLDERAEDVAAAALSPDAMTERIALRVGPTRPMPMTLRALASLAVLGLLIVGSAVAMLLGSQPPAPPSMPGTFECTADAPDFPEFDGQILHPITVIDETGLAEACRRITFEAVQVIRETIGPAFPGSMDRSSIFVSHADESGKALLVFWVQHSCDQDATVNLRRLETGRITLEVNQDHLPGPSGGECTPGGSLGALDISLSEPVAAGDVRESINRIEIPESVAGEPPATYDCAANAPDFPEFDGQELEPISVIDETGLATGCRRVTTAAAQEIRDTIGPPFEGVSNVRWLGISRADASGTALLVMWMTQDCDHAAEMNLRFVELGVRLHLDQRRSEICAAGTGLAAVEISFRQPLSPDRVHESISRPVTTEPDD